MAVSRHAQRESFSRCPETCPAVDKALHDWLTEVGHDIPRWLEESVQNMVDATKGVGTNKLRDALTEACSDLLDSEEEVTSLKSEIQSLEQTIDELRSQVRSLERELSEVGENA